MPIALLETKLYIPRSQRGLVLRPRLSERLDRGTASKLVLVPRLPVSARRRCSPSGLRRGRLRRPMSGWRRGSRSIRATMIRHPSGPM